MEPFLWTCPYCGRHATITRQNYSSGNYVIALTDTEYGKFGLTYIAVSCPNTQCRRVTFSISLREMQWTGSDYLLGSEFHYWNLLPESEAKPQPDYIPTAILEDYYEACRIKNLSPKASATLSRRCLQGMIRDFWKVGRKPNLAKEIEAIEDKVDASTWKAIDGVRKVGKIGAHMEEDVNLIIEVEPEEAQVLIGLIEMLFEEWYVARHEREQRVAQMIELGEQKQQEMDAAKEQAAEPPKEKASEPPPEKG